MIFTHQTDSTGTFYLTATYKANGLYEAHYVPQIAGDYVVNVMLYDDRVDIDSVKGSGPKFTDIVGSPFNLVVTPGEISSALSRTSIISDAQIDKMVAGTTYRFDIQLVDLYNNNLIDGEDAQKIEIKALY